MKNGKLRPSAIRDFPKGIAPIFLKQLDDREALAASEEDSGKVLLSAAPSTGAEKNHIDVADNAFLTGENDKMCSSFDRKKHDATPAQKSETFSKLESKQDNSLKKPKAAQLKSKRIPSSSPPATDKQVNAKDKEKQLPKAVNHVRNMPTKAVKSIEKESGADKVLGTDDVQRESMVEGVQASTIPQAIKYSVPENESSLPTALLQEEQVVLDRTKEISMDHFELVEKEGTEMQLSGMKLLDSYAEKERRVDEKQAENENLTGIEESKQPLSVEDKSGTQDVPDDQGVKHEALPKVADQKKNSHPAKRKPAIRDMVEPLLHTKNKIEEPVEKVHVTELMEAEVSPAKSMDIQEDNAATDNSKMNRNSGQKRRLVEEVGSSEKSKKLKPSIEVQAQSKSRNKEPPSKSTPKSQKKSATPSESSKKVRRSSLKSVDRAVASITGEKDARNLFLQALRMFDAVRRKFLQDEEIHGKQAKGARADLQAASLLKDNNASPNHQKSYGPIPGLHVGDIFLFRTELSFARVHGPIQGGIEYLTTKDSEFNASVAVSIISNVGQDGEDNGDELFYTGQGGRSADNRQIAHQKLERGNLAMDGSRKFKTPVRVLRGLKDMNSPTGKVYVYDGLYNVEETLTAKGSGGFDEFKFRLQRMPDQPELGFNMLKLAADLKSQTPSSRKHVVIEDISKGMESQAICVENMIDDETGPTEFKYSTKSIYPDSLKDLKPHSGCKCSGICSSASSCSCFERNGDEFPYLNGGNLVRQKDFIFECGSHCSCSSGCRNRTPERGPKFRLEVFKTVNKGWGVRALEMIPAGSFVCEYVGEVIAKEEDAKNCSDKKHMLFTRWLPGTTLWGEVPSSILDRASSTIRPDAGKPEFVIDAGRIGNVSRFINHSCLPNLLLQRVFSDHEDVQYPQFKFFAVDNILPLRELTFDYGHPPLDVEQEREEIECLCGSLNCRGKLYS
ncbi:hypothetical protein KP509_13G009600 [Ceratopteris richardii]|nr:hypothetical protein KP509_13G009600 [Ceratopteris richardii]